MELERPILHFGFHLVSSILSSFSSFSLKSAKICEHSTPFSQRPEMAEYIINRIPLPAEERMQDTLLLRRCISHPSKDASAIQNRPRKHQFCTIGWENFYFAEQRCIREKHPDKNQHFKKGYQSRWQWYWCLAILTILFHSCSVMLPVSGPVITNDKHAG